MKPGIKKGLRVAVIAALSLVIFFVLSTIIINIYMVFVEKVKVKSVEAWRKSINSDPKKDMECIFVLGCSVKPDGTPSDMLRDRLDRALQLYQEFPCKIVVSGDHTVEEYYNEVACMKSYLVDAGVPSDMIYMDHKGYSTYESMYRACHIFGIRKMTIVTQEYHLYRALYLAEAFGIQADGVSAGGSSYKGQTAREIREIAARDKDFLYSLFLPKPKDYGDEKYSLEESAEKTDWIYEQ